MCRLSHLALFFALIPAAFPATIRVPADYPTIQGGIDAAGGGDTVLVAPGTYQEHLEIDGKNLVIRSEAGPFDTVIEGQSYVPVVKVCSSVSVLDGFTVCNGKGDGVRCESYDITIQDNIITGNGAISGTGVGIRCLRGNAMIADNLVADNAGYGIYCHGSGHSSFTITGNVIRRNGDSGVKCAGCSATITNNTITGNHGRLLGGGIYCRSVYLTRISGNVILENRRGGIYCWGGDIHLEPLILTDNVVAWNTSETTFGGVLCEASVAALSGNTIVHNTTAYGNGGLAIRHDSNLHPLPVISNTILWGNRGPMTGQLSVTGYNMSGVLEIHHSLVEGTLTGSALYPSSYHVKSQYPLIWGPGIIDADPLLVGPRSKDCHLSWDSPCRDAGDNGSAIWGPDDFEGDPRIAGGRVDIGADEFYHHLYHVGDVIAGRTATMRVVGPPAAPVRLALGSSFSVGGIRTPHGNLLIGRPPYPFSVTGTISSRGVLDFPLTVPATASPGDLFPLQALVGRLGAPQTRITNLHVLEVE